MNLRPLALSLIVAASLWFHLYHFERFNFSGDQGAASQRAWEIYRDKQLTLVGIPITSWEYNGLHAHISSLAYYLQIVFLGLGSWEPPLASAIFAVTATLMIIPLYCGVVRLTGERQTALVAAAVYGLLPIYIDYTSFLWNPNYQLWLLPVSIYCLGHARENRWWLAATGIVWGAMICLHYQFALAVLGAHLFLLAKKRYADLGKLAAGSLMGVTPILALEVNTHFYNTRLLWQILLHAGAHQGDLPTYYMMVSGLLLFIFWLYFFRVSIRPAVGAAIIAIILAIDAVIYLPAPTAMWHVNAPGWFYRWESRAHQVIEAQNLINFNIVNLAYPDPLASVQKYLLLKDDPVSYSHLSADYYHNDHLFIIAPHDANLVDSINYEVNTFVPEATASWPLSPDYDLFLWSR